VYGSRNAPRRTRLQRVPIGRIGPTSLFYDTNEFVASKIVVDLLWGIALFSNGYGGDTSNRENKAHVEQIDSSAR